VGQVNLKPVWGMWAGNGYLVLSARDTSEIIAVDLQLSTAFLVTNTNLTKPRGLYIDEDRVLVADTDNNVVRTYFTVGTTMSSTSTSTSTSTSSSSSTSTSSSTETAAPPGEAVVDLTAGAGLGTAAACLASSGPFADGRLVSTLTLETWLRPAITAPGRLWTLEDVSGEPALVVDLSVNGSLCIAINGGAATCSTADDDAALAAPPPGIWTHVAAVVAPQDAVNASALRVRLMLNASAAFDFVVTNGPLQPLAAAYIGGDGAVDASPPPAEVAYARLWASARSASELAATSAGVQLSSDTSQLAADWPMDDGFERVARDTTGRCPLMLTRLTRWEHEPAFDHQLSLDAAALSDVAALDASLQSTNVTNANGEPPVGSDFVSNVALEALQSTYTLLASTLPPAGEGDLVVEAQVLAVRAGNKRATELSGPITVGSGGGSAAARPTVVLPPGLLRNHSIPADCELSVFVSIVKDPAATSTGEQGYSVVDVSIRDTRNCTPPSLRGPNGELNLDNLPEPVEIVLVLASAAPTYQLVPGAWNSTLPRPGCTPVGSAACLGYWDTTAVEAEFEMQEAAASAAVNGSLGGGNGNGTATVTPQVVKLRTSSLKKTTFGVGIDFTLEAPEISAANFNPENAPAIWITFGVIVLFVMVALAYSWIERRAFDVRQGEIQTKGLVDTKVVDEEILDLELAEKPLLVGTFQRWGHDIKQQHSWMAAIWPQGLSTRPKRTLKVGERDGEGLGGERVCGRGDLHWPAL
jgi:hypothetical protein